MPSLHANAYGQVSYDKEHQDLKAAMALIGLIASKSTHLPRGVVARLLAHHNVPAEDIAHLGVWELAATLLDVYLRSLPLKSMLVIAGALSHLDPRTYHCARANVPVPAELQRMIFPWLEEYVEQLGPDVSSYPHPHTTSGFIRLLRWFREVILQVGIQSEQGSIPVDVCYR